MTNFSNSGFNFQASWGQHKAWFASLIKSRFWLSLNAKRLRESKKDANSDLAAQISSEMLAIFKADAEEREKNAHASALAGTGPMPYDREWYAAGCNFEHLIEQAEGINWHVANELLEVTEWALASPQGQRALALQDEPTNPGGETLRTLLELREALTDKVRQELFEHIRQLRQPDVENALLDELEEELCS